MWSIGLGREMHLVQSFFEWFILIGDLNLGERLPWRAAPRCVSTHHQKHHPWEDRTEFHGGFKGYPQMVDFRKYDFRMATRIVHAAETEIAVSVTHSQSKTRTDTLIKSEMTMPSNIYHGISEHHWTLLFFYTTSSTLYLTKNTDRSLSEMGNHHVSRSEDIFHLGSITIHESSSTSLCHVGYTETAIHCRKKVQFTNYWLLFRSTYHINILLYIHIYIYIHFLYTSYIPTLQHIIPRCVFFSPRHCL